MKMKLFFRNFYLVFLFVLFPLFAYAQDSKDLNLDELLSMDKPVEEKKEDPFSRMLKQAKWTWTTNAYSFVQSKSGQDAGDDKKNQQINMQLFFDANYKTKDFELKIDFLGWIGTEKDSFWPSNPDTSRSANFTQIYLKKDLENSNLFLGYKQVEDGIITLFSPANHLARVDSLVPTDSIKLGVWQAAWVGYDGNNTTELRLLPYFQESRVPAKISRWSSKDSNQHLVGVEDQGDLKNNEVEDKKISHRLQDMGGFFKRKMRVAGADFLASAYYGYLPNSSIKRTVKDYRTKYERVHVKGAILATGVSAVKGSWELHGEAALQIPENRKDDSFLKYVGGFEYDTNLFLKIDGIETAKLVIEYANEWVITEQNHPEYPYRTHTARVGRNSIFLLQKVDINDKNKLFYGFTYNISKDDNWHRIGGEHKFGTANSIELAYEWFNGKDNTQFGRWHENDRLILKFTKKF